MPVNLRTFCEPIKHRSDATDQPNMHHFKIDEKHEVTLMEAEAMALRQLDSSSSLELVPQEVLDSLIRKGAIATEPDGSINITELGEAMYHYVKSGLKRPA